MDRFQRLIGHLSASAPAKAALDAVPTSSSMSEAAKSD
jgi:hypothetical protein